MSDVVAELRAACAAVVARARLVAVDHDAIEAYAASLSPALEAQATAPPDPEAHLAAGSPEELAAFWLTLDAINFGSGWFPTLRKRPGRSGYFTVAIAVRERFDELGPFSASELAALETRQLAVLLGQDPSHPLMELYARSLRDLGEHVSREHDGRFAVLAGAAGASAVAFVSLLGGWDCFADVCTYDGIRVPFLKRAQIAAADLSDAGVARFTDLDRLTMFADNLVPHVLRLDEILRYAPELLARIQRGDLLEHGSPEEVEIRACALNAVELIAAALPGTTAAAIDRTLWNRGQRARYKAVPRHRSRCTAY
jgi:hypothetical protein